MTDDLDFSVLFGTSLLTHVYQAYIITERVGKWRMNLILANEPLA